MEDRPSFKCFRIISLLGSGAMGRVFLAEVIKPFQGLKIGTLVALKVIRPHLLHDEEAKARLARELDIGLTLNDPHLVKVYGSGWSEDVEPFVVMELLQGDSLDQLLRDTTGALPVERAVKLTLGIANGLRALHEKGIVHRDLKPANIMVLPGDHVKLVDFGLARVLNASVRLTQSSHFLGTPAYASPEQLNGSIGPPSDLFSLGVIMYEMMCGQHPFPDNDLPQLLLAIQTFFPEPPVSLNPDLPLNLCRVIDRLLEKDISYRLSSAEEVIAALQDRAGSDLIRFLEQTDNRRVESRLHSDGMLHFAPHFQGRKREMELIRQKVFEQDVASISITGIKGLGKTALILEIARQMESGFADGGILFNLEKDPLTWEMLVERTFLALQYKPQSPHIVDELIQALSVHPCLLVIDGAERFLDEDWKGFGEFLERIEHKRADGGFDAWPSAVVVGARAIPVMEHNLRIEEIGLEGLSPEDGASLLGILARDRGPDEWRNEAEREWTSMRVGGHPEMLRQIAFMATRGDYELLKQRLSTFSGKLQKQLDKVIGWSVERLGPEGRKLLPCIACFEQLSFDTGLLSAAAGTEPDLEFADGLDQLQYAGGLIHWDPHSRIYRFHASLLEWVRIGVGSSEPKLADVAPLEGPALRAAHGRVAEVWESRIGKADADPKSLSDLQPFTSAVRHRISEGEIRRALEILEEHKLHTSASSPSGDTPWYTMIRLGGHATLVALAEDIVRVIPEDADPYVWARALHLLGCANMKNIGGDQNANKRRAAELFESASLLLERESHPVEWGQTKYHLGTSLYETRAGNFAENCDRAIEYYNQALSVFTRESYPEKWASVIDNLGSIYRVHPAGDPKTNAEKAIECHELALDYLRNEPRSHEYAMTLGNLALAWGTIPRDGTGRTTLKAIGYYKEMLETVTLENSPSIWARTLVNLGGTYLLLPRQNNEDRARKSLESFEKALTYYNRKDTPHDWAWTTNRCGRALRVDYAGDRRETLAKAQKCHRSALKVHTRDKYPFFNGVDRYDLGLTLLFAARIEDEATRNKLLDEAAGHFDACLEIWREMKMEQNVSETQELFNLAYKWRSAGEAPTRIPEF